MTLWLRGEAGHAWGLSHANQHNVLTFPWVQAMLDGGYSPDAPPLFVPRRGICCHHALGISPSYAPDPEQGAGHDGCSPQWCHQPSGHQVFQCVGPMDVIVSPHQGLFPGGNGPRSPPGGPQNQGARHPCVYSFGYLPRVERISRNFLAFLLLSLFCASGGISREPDAMELSV